MAWSTPKTNWAASDGIGAADLERIEGNIEDLDTRLGDYVLKDFHHRLVHLSGCDTGSQVGASSQQVLQQVAVNVPNTAELQIKNARWAGFGTHIKFKVLVSGESSGYDGSIHGAAWDTWYYPDPEGVTTLYENTSGSEQQKILQIIAVNTNSIPENLGTGAGWEVLCSVYGGVSD